MHAATNFEDIIATFHRNSIKSNNKNKTPYSYLLPGDCRVPGDEVEVLVGQPDALPVDAAHPAKETGEEELGNIEKRKKLSIGKKHLFDKKICRESAIKIDLLLSEKRKPGKV